jgi:hypothetical protein
MRQCVAIVTKSACTGSFDPTPEARLGLVVVAEYIRIEVEWLAIDGRVDRL